jgi:hypothetical protein
MSRILLLDRFTVTCLLAILLAVSGGPIGLSCRAYGQALPKPPLAGPGGPSEAAIAAGLKWLVAQQAEDGHWDLDVAPGSADGRKRDIAGTAYAVLALQGAGGSHKGGAKEFPYTKNVESGLKYLIKSQGRDGLFGADLHTSALAATAVCEAYGITSDPIIKAPAQRAIDALCRKQLADGGWAAKAGESGQTVLTGLVMQALKSGQMGGLSVPTENLRKVNPFLDSVAADELGGTYAPAKGGKVDPTATAAALLSRMYLGWGPRNPGLNKGIDFLVSHPPGKEPNNLLYLKMASHVLLYVGGPAWEKWNPQVRDVLIKAQEKDGNNKGSWAGAGGRLEATSQALLTLETYYRFTPLYRPGR